MPLLIRSLSLIRLIRSLNLSLIRSLNLSLIRGLIRSLNSSLISIRIRSLCENLTWTLSMDKLKQHGAQWFAYCFIALLLYVLIKPNFVGAHQVRGRWWAHFGGILTFCVPPKIWLVRVTWWADGHILVVQAVSGPCTLTRAMQWWILRGPIRSPLFDARRS